MQCNNLSWYSSKRDKTNHDRRVVDVEKHQKDLLGYVSGGFAEKTHSSVIELLKW